MHLKNWSLIYPDRRRAALAPAYDFGVDNRLYQDANAALNFSRTKRSMGSPLTSFRTLQTRPYCPKACLDAANSTVALFHQHWRLRREPSLTAAAVTAIDEHVSQHPVA